MHSLRIQMVQGVYQVFSNTLLPTSDKKRLTEGNLMCMCNFTFTLFVIEAIVNVFHSWCVFWSWSKENDLHYDWKRKKIRFVNKLKMN